MNRNETTFSQAPTLKMERHLIPLRQNIKTTFNAGYIIPFFVNLDVLPADTWKLSYSAVIRQTTTQTPTMDNAYVDFYFFGTPWRLTWSHAKQFFGENTTSAWTQTTEYVIPQYYTNNNGKVLKGNLADYMGIPINTLNLHFSQLPFRAYTLIYNEYFRDQNLIAPVTVSLSDTDKLYDPNSNEMVLRKAAKFHDYFTSCLPAPQKGPNVVTVPIGTTAPVFQTTVEPLNLTGIYNGEWSDHNGLYMAADSPSRLTVDQGTMGRGYGISPANSNLVADLSQAVAATINAMRESFAVQRIYERDARSGTRYREYILAAYGVSNGDARMQIPEYLGGERVPLQLLQVAQTGATTGNKALGDLAAFGHTATGKVAFTKSFTEHTILLGLMVVRTDQSYDRGLNRMWSRRRRFEVYDPALAFLGEQAVLNKEIFCTGVEATDNQVFGYQERWAEMRYLPNMITGAFRTNYASTLDFWHYGNAFGSLPVLSQSFLEETTANIDRTLVVPSSTEDQFLADIQIEVECYRRMPVHSIPGLLDHF